MFFVCGRSSLLYGLSLVVEKGGYLASCRGGFPSCRAQAVGHVGFGGLVVSTLSGYSSCALEHRLGIVAHGLNCSTACAIFLDR